MFAHVTGEFNSIHINNEKVSPCPAAYQSIILGTLAAETVDFSNSQTRLMVVEGCCAAEQHLSQLKITLKNNLK